MSLPVAHLGRRYHFSASHRLHVEELTAADNQATYGKCNNPFGHGHNYAVEVTYSGAIDASTGMVVDLGVLDAFAEERVLWRFDHQNLNLLPDFATLVPTTENLSVVLHEIFSSFPRARLVGIHVEETSNNSFDYAGGNVPAGGNLPDFEHGRES